MPTPTQIAIDHIRATEDAARHLLEEVKILRAMLFKSVSLHGTTISINPADITDSLEFDCKTYFNEQTEWEREQGFEPVMRYQEITMTDPIKLGLGSRRVEILTRAGLIKE